MMDQAAAGLYRQMDVLAMSPAQRVVALTARVHLSLRQARMAIEAGDIEEREKRLNNATAIIHELLAALDLDRGGEIASRLAGIYTWLLRECFAVHIKPEAARLDSPISIVGELHSAWSEVARLAPQASIAGAA